MFLKNEQQKLSKTRWSQKLLKLILALAPGLNPTNLTQTPLAAIGSTIS
jgi:hypothetical protein